MKNLSYSDAVAEIEEILSRIEKGDLDVDELTEKVKRVTFLIKACKAKLMTAELEINTILDEEIKQDDGKAGE